MKLNLQKPLVFFDLETTGINVSKDRIVEIACVKVMPDGAVITKPEKEGAENRFVVNPEMPIPAEASAVHGIYDKDVEDKPTFRQIAKGLFKFLHGCDLAGFNSNRFDIPLLAEEFMRVGVDFSMEGRNVIDVQVIFHMMEKRTLSAGYKFYCCNIFCQRIFRSFTIMVPYSHSDNSTTAPAGRHVSRWLPIQVLTSLCDFYN